VDRASAARDPAGRPLPGGRATRRFIATYYLLTPLFWLIDWTYGANVRVVALQDSEGWRALYYVLCMAGGLALWVRPLWSDLLGLLECSIALLLLILGILLPYWRLADQIAADRFVANPYTPELVINFVLAGTVWLIAFYGRLGVRPFDTIGLSGRMRR
jgi:hypothetical protein